MLNSSLFELLKSFNPDEISEFDKMVCSPYFNRKSAVTKFWKEIIKYAPDFTSMNLSREKIYKKVFPSKEFNYGTLKNLVHDLTRLAEKFIELEVYKGKITKQSFNLLEGYLERGLKGYFEKTFRTLETRLETDKNEAEYHRSKYHIEVLKQNYLIQQDKYYQTSDNIRSANNYLTMAYFIDFFNNNYNTFCIKNELSKDDQNIFIKKALDFFDHDPVEFDYRVNLYYNAFMLVFDGGQDYFYHLKKQFEQNITLLSDEQKYNFCVALANFCSLKRRAGLEEFAKKAFEIYRFMIDNRLFSIDNVKNIDGAFYINVSGTALDSGEHEWAIYFIEKFKDLLAEDVRENYYYYAMIEYNIKLKQFNEVITYLSKIRHNNYTDKLNIKKWDLITSYELGYFEELRYQIDTTKHFIKNDTKLSQDNKDKLNNFTGIITKLLYLNENKNSRDLNADLFLLKEEINKPEIYYKDWLHEKVSELKSSKNI